MNAPVNRIQGNQGYGEPDTLSPPKKRQKVTQADVLNAQREHTKAYVEQSQQNREAFNAFAERITSALERYFEMKMQQKQN